MKNFKLQFYYVFLSRPNVDTDVGRLWRFCRSVLAMAMKKRRCALKKRIVEKKLYFFSFSTELDCPRTWTLTELHWSKTTVGYKEVGSWSFSVGPVFTMGRFVSHKIAQSGNFRWLRYLFIGMAFPSPGLYGCNLLTPSHLGMHWSTSMNSKVHLPTGRK